ncbi:adenylate kinase 7-like isoform X2 [Aricia agestis]|uniref:adenylate kinase 7-like isoform X2 n=1 Tax=Aricia agestis TaxID=91739 RepID=UPI001C202DC2|nr:adenylate kinase 7-like isoform X2 [Aricia agestis]
MKKMTSPTSQDFRDWKKYFSSKRYFINNLDSYHGPVIIKEVSNIIMKKDTEPETETSKPNSPADEERNNIALENGQPYEIIGTVTDPHVTNMDFVSRIISKSECLAEMISCGTVILDITSENSLSLKPILEFLKLLRELLEIESKLNEGREGENYKKRYLILISTVMTWALTKPLDPDTPDMPFIETDFRKRKPHPNFRTHYDIENEVIGMARKFKPQIGTIVVASGITYGGQEDVLFYWFQKAWECEPLLPIISTGGNFLPLINVQDLAKVIYKLIENFPKKLYILAVEQNIMKQREIIKALGRISGSGMFTNVPAEKAFLIPELDQRMYDMIMLNVSMEPVFIVEEMGLEWTSEMTFEENVPTLMKQFTKARKLKPFKQFRVNYWEMKDKEREMKEQSPRSDMSLSDEEEDDDDDDRETTRQTLALLKSGRPFSNEEIIGYIRERLLRRDALNRGWVLDGVPTTLQECSLLFDIGEEENSVASEDQDTFDEDVDLYNNVLKKLLPDIVVSLEATDEFICDKAMRLPNGDGQFDEEVVLQRLREFRAGDTNETTPLSYFEELEIHPMRRTVGDHNDYAMKSAFSAVTLRLGRACRYKKLIDARIEAEIKAKAELDAKKNKEAKEQAELERKMKETREKNMEYWAEVYASMQEEEEAALAAETEPMRQYLMNHIFPTLTTALLEVARVRPDDPVDFLAEYLFKMNPTGKMLEPGFNLQAEMLLKKIKMLDDSMKDLDIKIDPLLPPDVDAGGPTIKKKIDNMFSL